MLSSKICTLVQPLSIGSGFLLPVSCPYVQKKSVHHHKEARDLLLFLGIKRSSRARANRNTHINERYLKKPRGRKMVLIDIPEDSIEQKMEEMTPMEMRTYLLRKGVNPYKHMHPRVWSEHQITFQSFGDTLEPNVLPDGLLKGSLSEKSSEIKQRFLNRWHNWKNGSSRIRKKEGFEKFDAKAFGPTADMIYVEAHRALVARDKALIHKYLTESAFQKMWPDVEKGSVMWDLIEHVEPSKVISIRCVDIPMKSGNDIAQLTVRMHTVQKLAIYDRFGHLILGSESEARPVLEYVIFENHIASLDGVWRLHDKLYPKWAQTKQAAKITTPVDEQTTILESPPNFTEKKALET